MELTVNYIINTAWNINQRVLDILLRKNNVFQINYKKVE